MSHVLAVGDCFAGMAALPDAAVDHVVTDPPYEAEAHTQQRRVKRSGGVLSVEPLAFAPMTEERRVEAARQFARLARRWVAVFCQVEAAMLWRESLEEAGLVYKRTGIWVKPDGQPQLSGDRPGMGYESIVLAHSKGRSRWNGGGSVAVWRFNKSDSGGKPHDHPTQKPLALMEALIRDFTDPGETILDPFAGSGTTLVAAKRLGRHAIGWEMNAEWAEAARRRIEQTAEEPGLVELEKWERDGKRKREQLTLGGNP